jgi:hypothetical protein
MVGHSIFAFYTGWMLSANFLEDKAARFFIASLLVSPIFPALAPGHFEKVMSWPWVLLGLYFLFNERLTNIKRGFYSGLCLAVVPLTGSNYYALYAGVLYVLIALGIKNTRLLFMMICGALPGLLHLPAVWSLVGQSRMAAGFFEPQNTMNWLEMFLSITTGWVKPIEWEKMAVLGFPVIFLFLYFLWRFLVNVRKCNDVFCDSIQWMTLVAILIFTLFKTGLMYAGHHFLDTFRVPVRAIAFLALSLMLFNLLGIRRYSGSYFTQHFVFIRFLLLASVLYIFPFWWWARPIGTDHDMHLADELVSYLRSQDAQSVWFSTVTLDEMFIDAALNTNDIALPNVYYGDMKQKVPVEGPYCGYSFDFLLTRDSEVSNTVFLLRSEVEREEVLGEIPFSQLNFIRSFPISARTYHLYKVVCLK